MKTLKIKITNTSPLMLSSGDGEGTLIDSDVVWDNMGLPYFPARRLRGLLRESALESIEMMEMSGLINKISVSGVDSLFGKPGEEGKIRIYDLFLESYEAIQDWMGWLQKEGKNDFFSSEKIKNAITQIRQQTAINREGIALDNSLRTSRALNKGFTFSGNLFVLAEEEKHTNLLSLACRNLRRAGLNRNRGFGEIEVKLFDWEKELTEDILRSLKGVIANV